MIFKHFTAGIYETNNYILICEKTKEAVLVDAGGNYKKTAEILKENNAELKYILHTHCHWDHIMGDAEIQKNFGTKVFIHKDDEFLVNMFEEQLKMLGLPFQPPPNICGFFEDDEEITVGELKLKVIHTPGHSPGGVCFLCENILISGDTLFQGSVGRTDLPGGSFEVLGKSIKNKLFVLDENIKVFPGHGDSTTIGWEKQNNPYFGMRA